MRSLKLRPLRDSVRNAYLLTFAGSPRAVYLAAAPVIAIAFALAWFVEDALLRKRH